MKIVIDKNEYDKRNAGFEKYEIEELVKPKPNSRFFFMPVKLWIYNFQSPEKSNQKEKIKEEKCLKKTKLKIQKINSRLKKVQKKANSLNKNSTKYKRLNKKQEKLQAKKGNREEKSCKKQHWSKKLGEAPVFLSPNDYFRNRRRIRVFLKNKGYYQIKIDTSNTYKSRRRVKITYSISPGKPHLISKIKYKIEDRNISEIVNKNKQNSLLKPGNRFDIQTIEDERKRISNTLRNEGYYNFSKDFIYFSVDTIGKNNQVDIIINISKIKDKDGNEIIYQKHIIKNVFIYPYFKPNEALINKNEYYKNQDTIIYYSKEGKKYHLIYKGIPRINPKAIVRGLYIAPEDYFNLKEIKSSYKYLASLPVIQTANINFIKTEPYTEIQDSIKYLNCEIKLTQDKLQSYDFSTEVTHTSGNWGVAGFLNYTHNNFFRNTESLNLKLNGELNRITKNSNYDIPDPIGLFNSKTFGADLSIKFPRLFVPIPLKKFIQRSNPKTIVTGNISYTNRPDYKSSIAGLSWGYNWNSKETKHHALTLITNDFVRFYDPIESFQAWIVENNLVENYESHLIFGSAYKFTYNNQRIRKRKNYFFLTVYGKSVGNSLYAQKKIGENILGKTYEKDNNSYLIFGNAFAQFIKSDIDIRYYRKLSRAKDNLVFRIFGGAALPYGNLNVIPFSEQYFSGGANGIRAWEERSLGPGSYTDADEEKAPYYRQRADIKLEGNFEYRMKLFWKMEGALFIDAGNIWAINEEDQREGAIFDVNRFYKEIAIGSGFGIRMDLDFLIVRLDLGLKVKDPTLPEENRWIPTNHIFSTDNMKLNLGIGYPF